MDALIVKKFLIISVLSLDNLPVSFNIGNITGENQNILWIISYTWRAKNYALSLTMFRFSHLVQIPTSTSTSISFPGNIFTPCLIGVIWQVITSLFRKLLDMHECKIIIWTVTIYLPISIFYLMIQPTRFSSARIPLPGKSPPPLIPTQLSNPL